MCQTAIVPHKNFQLRLGVPYPCHNLDLCIALHLGCRLHIWIVHCANFVAGGLFSDITTRLDKEKIENQVEIVNRVRARRKAHRGEQTKGGETGEGGKKLLGNSYILR